MCKMVHSIYHNIDILYDPWEQYNHFTKVLLGFYKPYFCINVQHKGVLL